MALHYRIGALTRAIMELHYLSRKCHSGIVDCLEFYACFQHSTSEHSCIFFPFDLSPTQSHFRLILLFICVTFVIGGVRIMGFSLSGQCIM